MQLKEREQRLKEATEVAQEPLARYEGDEKLETHLKDKLMKEDPMMQYIYKKKQKKIKAPSKLSSAECSRSLTFSQSIRSTKARRRSRIAMVSSPAIDGMASIARQV